MQLKTEGVLILFIVVIFATTCFEKIASKVYRLVHDLLPVKSLVHHILQTMRPIEFFFDLTFI